MWFKSIQKIVLISLVLATSVPAVSIAAPKQKMQKTTIKKKKTSFLNKLTWDHLMLGGCAVFGILAFILSLDKKTFLNTNTGTKPRPTPRPNPTPATPNQFQNAGLCTICYTNNVNMTTPCCNRTQDGICRECWARDVRTGDFEVDGRIMNDKQRDACPFCRADKTLRKTNESCVIL